VGTNDLAMVAWVIDSIAVLGGRSQNAATQMIIPAASGCKP